MARRLLYFGDMPPTATPLIIFTDLDGCLLNKHDYDWSAAAVTLETLRQRQIPVVMNSSKTVPEMLLLAEELGLTGETFISENGSVIHWGPDSTEVIGAARDEILAVLTDLKKRFRFRSFADLGLDGVVNETQLPVDKAQLALDRQGTEPLLWDDTDECRSEFEQRLHDHKITLVKGGRFWHVAGRTSKGKAMQQVARHLCGSVSDPNYKTIIAAIGDSPIDQSMLDAADVPIGIPSPTGLQVTIALPRGIVAVQQGAVGWAEAVTELLSRLDSRAS